MKPYQNPIIPGSPTATTWDPYVLRHGGCYYHCYSNKQGVFISRSETLWGIGEGETTMVYDCTAEGAITDWFAPELHRIGDKWYIYASPDYGNFLHVMTVLVGEGDTPLCAYENRGMVRGIENKWNLDGTVLWHNDKLYFVVAGMYMGQMLGSVEETSMGILTVTPRDEQGNPIAVSDLVNYVVKDENGNPLKEWYAIADYLDSMEGDLDSRYAQPDGRKVVYKSLSPVKLLRNANIFTYIVLVLIAGLITAIVFITRAVVRKIKRKKAAKAAA